MCRVRTGRAKRQQGWLKNRLRTGAQASVIGMRFSIRACHACIISKDGSTITALVAQIETQTARWSSASPPTGVRRHQPDAQGVCVMKPARAATSPAARSAENGGAEQLRAPRRSTRHGVMRATAGAPVRSGLRRPHAPLWNARKHLQETRITPYERCGAEAEHEAPQRGGAADAFCLCRKEQGTRWRRRPRRAALGHNDTQTRGHRGADRTG